MLISIVVPIYNVEKYLERCITSLVNQSYKNIEIILVNDGSTDNSKEIAEKYNSNYDFISLVNKQNGGLSDARNKGLECCKGEYVLFVDSDDTLNIDTCEIIERTIKNYNINIDMLACGFTKIENNEKKKYIHSSKMNIFDGKKFMKNEIYTKTLFMASWSYIYRREFLQKNNLKFKKGILHEDEEFTPRALLKAETILPMDSCFYNYYINPNTITTKKDKRRNAIDLYETCLSLELLYNQLKDSDFKTMMLDSLVVKYLNIFQSGKLFVYGEEYMHLDFLKRNSFERKTKCKVKLLSLSPRLYYYINLFMKKVVK